MTEKLLIYTSNLKTNKQTKYIVFDFFSEINIGSKIQCSTNIYEWHYLLICTMCFQRQSIKFSCISIFSEIDIILFLFIVPR